MEYTIVIKKSNDGCYVGQCEQVPEAISEGKSIDELKENMKDAILMILKIKQETTIKAYLGQKFIRRKISIL
jgi:predicted RNase H-like HicB family nuclease